METWSLYGSANFEAYKILLSQSETFFSKNILFPPLRIKVFYLFQLHALFFFLYSHAGVADMRFHPRLSVDTVEAIGYFVNLFVLIKTNSAQFQPTELRPASWYRSYYYISLL